MLKDPRPYPNVTRKFHDMDTAVEDLPAMPKFSSSTDISQSWTPPPYWRKLLEMDTGPLERLEQGVKTWFVKGVIAAALIYVLAITVILLGKVMVIVMALK